MKIIRLFRKWAGYNDGDLVIVSENQANYLVNQAYGELVVKCPSFNNRLGGKGKHKLLPLTKESIDVICKNLASDILRAERAIQKLKQLRGEVCVENV